MPGLMRGVARTAVVAGTAAHVAGNVQHRQQQKWAGQEALANQQAAPQQPVAAAPTPADTDAQMAQLTQLAQMKDQGIITQQEFDAKKKQILGL